MAFVPQDFADDTDFERFFLEKLGAQNTRLRDPASIHEARPGGGGNISIKVGSVVIGSERLETFRRSLLPLCFGAAYKVLDLLVENVLRANGATGRLRFDQKTAIVSSPPGALPAPLDARRDVWDRLAALYLAYVDGRHAIVHRRSGLSLTQDILVHDDSGAHVDTISAAEIASFAAAVHGIANLTIASSFEDIGVVAWHLNALGSRHGLPAVPDAVDPDSHRRLLTMELAATENLRIDLEAARETVAGQGPSIWDVEFRFEERRWTGRWDDIPSDLGPSVDFDPSSPPPWLRELLP